MGDRFVRIHHLVITRYQTSIQKQLRNTTVTVGNLIIPLYSGKLKDLTSHLTGSVVSKGLEI